MTSNKYFYSTVLHSNKIFAIGGRLNNASIDTVEYFEPEKMKWIDGPKLLQKFETHDSVNIDEVIYAAGDFESNKFLRFDPREGKWIFLADIPNKTFHTSMSVFEQTITCTGGCDTQTLCQLYDLKNGKWDQLPNLPIPFWGARSIENKASIVIIGGYNTDKMYSYNKNNQTWSALYIRLPEANCHSSKVWI
uniref:Uncharacterized protein n=1 Tax=Rhabditophanes sp. KR3021 TaxID=114890 RepID=A0AC35TJ85_9BILA